MDPIVFSPLRILVTAAACAAATALVLAWRTRRARADGGRARILALSAAIGLLVVAWRAASNAWQLNADVLPAISPADVGSGVLAWLALLMLAPLRPQPEAALRPWLLTSALVALVVYVGNVVLI